MRLAARTNAGRRSGANEDAIGVDPQGQFCFVADGMGGHASGDVASRIVKDTLAKALVSMPTLDAVRSAHDAVAAEGAANPAHGGMGSTVVVARAREGQGEIVWVGDSRAYLWRAGALRQLTRDHSFLEILREQEGLTESQMRGHPNKNLVTQTLGIGQPSPSAVNVPLRTGDWLLLCSDGLNDELDDAQIAAVLARYTTVEDAADALIEAALGAGGRDNVSVVIAQYDGPDGVSAAPPNERGKAPERGAGPSSRKAIVIAATTFALTLLVLYLVYRFVL